MRWETISKKYGYTKLHLTFCWFYSMALVPYVDNPLPALSKLHNSSAQFRFANRDLHLSQDWKQLGVAAVVWDAVSHIMWTLLLFFNHSFTHSLLIWIKMHITCVAGGGHVHVPGGGAGGGEGEAGDRAGSWNWTGGHRSSSAGWGIYTGLNKSINMPLNAPI